MMSQNTCGIQSVKSGNAYIISLEISNQKDTRCLGVCLFEFTVSLFSGFLSLTVTAFLKIFVHICIGIMHVISTCVGYKVYICHIRVKLC